MEVNLEPPGVAMMQKSAVYFDAGLDGPRRADSFFEAGVRIGRVARGLPGLSPEDIIIERGEDGTLIWVVVLDYYIVVFKALDVGEERPSRKVVQELVREPITEKDIEDLRAGIEESFY